MLDRSEPLDASPHAPFASKPPARQLGWLWSVATLCYAMAAILPVLDGAKASSALGPCVLGIAFGLALLARRPFAWRFAATGASLAFGSLWLGWTLAASAQLAWDSLLLAYQTGILAEASRRACWAAVACAGLGLWCKAPRALACVGAVACLAASLAMGMGWPWPWPGP